MPQPRFHKPVLLPDMDPLDTAPDPAARAELAHTTAALLISPSRDASSEPGRDDAATARFVHLAEEFGLDAIAEVWATAPPVSLPGALWRLYALREWIRRSPSQAAAWFSAGRDGMTAPEVVAGIASPPGPDEVARAADEILAGAFRGDFAMALARAAAFITVAARGRRIEEPEGRPAVGESAAGGSVASGAAAEKPAVGGSAAGKPAVGGSAADDFERLGSDLAAAARAYATGHLD